MDVVTLRAEIKAWEREFRAEHGRDPSVHEIKDRPDIADKYKRYKRLSKQPPIPSQPRLLSAAKPRAVKTEAPVLSSNPFSPVKQRRNHPHRSPLLSQRHANPFATPSKPKPPVHTPHVLEEDPSPLIHSHQRPPQPPSIPPTASHRGYLSAKTHTEDAVTRARKRLRGEHVSPSPVKEKRPRTGLERVNPGRGNLFTTLQAAKQDDSDDEVIEATPAKPFRQGKPLVRLFDDDAPAPAPTRTQSGLFPFALGPHSQRSSTKNGKRRAMSPPLEADEDDMDVDPSASSAAKLPAPKFQNRPVPSKLLSLAKSVLPSKHDLLDDARVEEKVADLTLKKRPAADPNNTPALALLPPSPPPYTADRHKAGAKSKAAPRKKTKLGGDVMNDDDDDDDGSTENDDDATVKVKETASSWRTCRPPPAGSDDDLDLDLITYHAPRPASPAEEAAEAEETVEIHLPAHLRRVLALSPHHDDGEKEQLARGLIYGRREGHYDPVRGGEIWGAGEVSDEDEDERQLDAGERKRHGRRRGGDDEDEEWEGEPVPWEVGEL